MIALTGGTGMIGSMIAWHLNTILNENNFVIFDDMTSQDQEKNIAKRKFIDFIDKNDLPKFFRNNKNITAVIHMGAISATTESNFNKLLISNIRYSQMLWSWCSANRVPFIYASSAATYGNGKNGYDDDESSLSKLIPLNAYGYSKHFFDQWACSQVNSNKPSPPQWCGLKFFNVYGPNEYHKNRMASVVFHAFQQFQKEKEIRLFKSGNPDYKDGMQLRDFIYVKDAVEYVMFFLKNNHISGLFNSGTGAAQSFNDLAEAVIKNTGGDKSNIKYIDMPNDLKGKYQYYTEANLDKILSTGLNLKFKNLEEGVNDYMKNYLLTTDRYA
ncbi:ADP-glyceromanno-heptose 6-epimerase [Methylophilaceae bacterium]|jgi:ADP-L-glycero-D-manno-heptose 6-epimerase|nr:ADP-glyceromanno-heptose 6-epimerase [Methylophilaceae bacterium]